MKFLLMVIISLSVSSAFASTKMPQCSKSFKQSYFKFETQLLETLPVLQEAAYHYLRTKSPSLKYSAGEVVRSIADACYSFAARGPNNQCLLREGEHWDKDIANDACNNIKRSYYENFGR